jgi:hypothetical protein
MKLTKFVLISIAVINILAGMVLSREVERFRRTSETPKDAAKDCNDAEVNKLIDNIVNSKLFKCSDRNNSNSANKFYASEEDVLALIETLIKDLKSNKSASSKLEELKKQCTESNERFTKAIKTEDFYQHIVPVKYITEVQAAPWYKVVHEHSKKDKKPQTAPDAKAAAPDAKAAAPDAKAAAPDAKAAAPDAKAAAPDAKAAAPDAKAAAPDAKAAAPDAKAAAPDAKAAAPDAKAAAPDAKAATPDAKAATPDAKAATPDAKAAAPDAKAATPDAKAAAPDAKAATPDAKAAAPKKGRYMKNKN